MSWLEGVASTWSSREDCEVMPLCRILYDCMMRPIGMRRGWTSYFSIYWTFSTSQLGQHDSMSKLQHHAVIQLKAIVHWHHMRISQCTQHS